MVYQDLGGQSDEEVLNSVKPPQEEDDEVLPKELADALKFLVDEVDRDDKEVRNIQLQEWKKFDLYWRGVQNVIWDDVAHDWRTVQDIVDEDPDMDLDPADYERTINTFRANLESIIAALTSSIPNVGFLPDDADDPDDVVTAKAYRRVVELIEKHNNAELLFVRIVFLLVNQGFVAIYNCPNASEEYGTKKQNIYGVESQSMDTETCPDCAGDLTDEPDHPDMDEKLCPDCQVPVVPNMEQTETQVPTVVGEEDIAKTREILEIYGPLNVKVPSYASNIKSCPYLVLESEHHPSMLMELYPHIKEKIKARGGDDSEQYTRWARETYSEMNVKNVTLRRSWLRPWFLNMLCDSKGLYDQEKVLREKFPKGIFCVYVNDVLAEVRDESMDEHWTLAINPLSDKVHSEPPAKFEAPVQDMRNEMIALTLETVQHGVSETFVDSDLLDFDAYKKSSKAPGSLVPVNAKPGTTVANRIHTVKPATLGREVDTFTERLDRDGQQLIGAVPSIWGGHTPGSKTLGEQEMNKNQALQRLGLIWKMASSLWARTMDKAVKSYCKNMLEDEKLTKRMGENSFVTIWVHRTELTGHVGHCEPEASENMPTSWSQKRGVLMELLQLNNEAINSAIFHPDNVSLVSRLLGFTDMTIPGDDDRTKKLRQIQELIKGQPMGPEEPSIPIEPEVDDIGVCVQTIKSWAQSEIGQYVKLSNPMGYENVIAQLRAYMQFEMMQMQGDPNAPMNQPGPGINAGATSSGPSVGEPPQVSDAQ